MKKIITFIIAFALCFTCFNPISASTFQSDSYDDANSLKALGITLPEYTSDSSPITRADFLCVLMQLLRHEKTAFNQAADFTDIVSGSAVSEYLESAVKLGLIAKAPLFYPERAVTPAEASKMIVIALGYEPEAASLGGWPGGYLAEALKLNIFKGIGTNFESLTYKTAFKLFKNMCETDIRIQTSFGTDSEYTVATGKNILTEYFNLKKVTGIIEADENTSIYDNNAPASSGKILLASSEYLYSGEYTLGANVTAYATTGEPSEIKYLSLKNTSFFTIQGDDFESASDSEINFISENGTRKKVRLSEMPAIIYNGKASEKIHSPKNISLKDGLINLVDNNGDNKYDIIFVYETRNMVVSSVNLRESKIFDDKSNSPINFKDADKCTIFLGNTEIEARNIEKGNILDCFISEDKKLIEIYLSDKAVSGKIVEADKNAGKVTIGETEYECTDYFVKNYFDSLKVSEDVTLYLNMFGKCVSADNSAGVMKYGYLYAASLKKGVAANVEVKLCTDSGEVKVMELADNVIIDDMTRMSAKDAFAYLGSEQLIRYSLDGNGKINVIDTAFSNSDRTSGSSEPSTGFLSGNTPNTDSLTRYSFAEEDAGTTLYYRESTIHPYFSLSGSTLIFCVDQTLSISDDKHCIVSNKNMFGDSENIRSDLIRPYDVSYDGNASAVVYYSAATAVTDSTAVSFVKSCTNAITPDGQSAIKLVTLSFTTFKFETSYITDEKIITSLYEAKNNPQRNGMPLIPGDIVRLSVGGDSTAREIILDYDYSSDNKINYFDASYNTILNYYKGYIYSCDPDSDMFMLSLADSREGIENAAKYCFFSYPNYYCFDSKEGTISPIEKSDFVAYRQDQENCSKVFFVSRWARGHAVIIYK